MSFKLNAIIIVIFFIIQIFNARFNAGFYYYYNLKKKYKRIAPKKESPNGAVKRFNKYSADSIYIFYIF